MKSNIMTNCHNCGGSHFYTTCQVDARVDSHGELHFEPDADSLRLLTCMVCGHERNDVSGIELAYLRWHAYRH